MKVDVITTGIHIPYVAGTHLGRDRNLCGSLLFNGQAKYFKGRNCGRILARKMENRCVAVITRICEFTQFHSDGCKFTPCVLMGRGTGTSYPRTSTLDLDCFTIHIYNPDM